MGATPLTALPQAVEIPDLRAGLAYIIAAAVATGTSTFTHGERITRGYGEIAARLQNVSLDITRGQS